MKQGGGWAIGSANGDGHIIPIDDLKPHTARDKGETVECACNPKSEIENGVTLWIHNSYDGREAFEEGERKVS